ncbi:MAG: hypothetical protein V2A53_09220, partial [bacterium]
MKRILILGIVSVIEGWFLVALAYTTSPWPMLGHDGQHTGRSNSILEGKLADGKLQHLSHIKTFGFSPEGIDKSWEAEHYDLVVDSASLPAYKHLNPDMLGVTGKIILY